MLQPRYSTKVHRAVRAPRRYFFDREAETMPRELLETLQCRRLRATPKDAWARVALHRSRLQAEDLRTLDALRALPFTLKSDLRDNYPYGLFARPRTELVRLHASSGTTGKPTVVGYT